MKESEDSKTTILAKPLEITPVMFNDKSVIELVDKLDKDLRSIVLDGETKEGRAECVTLANNVRKSKAHIDKVGASVVKPLKDKAKIIDGQRSEIKTKLEALAIHLRKPTTDWELKEETRISTHRANLQSILALKENIGFQIVPDLEKKQLQLKGFKELDYEEFQTDANLYTEGVEAALDGALAKAKQRVVDAAELEQLRKEKAEKEAREQPAPVTPPLNLDDPNWRPAPPQMPVPTLEHVGAVTPAPAPAPQVMRITREHSRVVHNDIVKALMEHCSLDEETSKGVVIAIAKGHVPHVSIRY